MFLRENINTPTVDYKGTIKLLKLAGSSVCVCGWVGVRAPMMYTHERSYLTILVGA